MFLIGCSRRIRIVNSIGTILIQGVAFSEGCEFLEIKVTIEQDGNVIDPDPQTISEFPIGGLVYPLNINDIDFSSTVKITIEVFQAEGNCYPLTTNSKFSYEGILEHVEGQMYAEDLSKFEQIE